MANTSITIRMDADLKRQTETLLEDMGLNMTTAFTIFAKTVVRQGKIPFEIVADPFFSASNQAALLTSMNQLSAEKTVSKTAADLEAME